MSEKTIHLFFAGSVVPDAAEFRTDAFSRSGNQFQMSLIASIDRSPICIDKVCSFVPHPAWPGDSTLIVRGCTEKLYEGRSVEILGFVNISILKAIWLTVAACKSILVWSWMLDDKDSGVVLAYNLSVPVGLLVVLTCRLAGVAVVFSVNDINIPGETVPRSIWTRLDYWQQRNALPLADGLLIVAPLIARDFAPKTDTCLVAGGIDATEPEQPLLNNHELPEGRMLVLLAGSLAELNGVREFIAAAEKCGDKNVHFLIAGRGELEMEVRTADARLMNFTYLGMLSRAELSMWFKRVDALVNFRLTKRIQAPYFYPGKLFEFIAAGRLIISTDVKGVLDELRDGVVIVEDETAEGLINAIERACAMNAQERNELAAHTAKIARERHSWDSAGQRVREFLQFVRSKRSNET